MGKNDFLTPKAIANRMKAKGLQKLRWYCQMCQKQCRDENGFKCHCMSESHQRQMQVFGQNQRRVLQGYSEEFEKTFLDLMRRSHRFSRIAATVVYNEYINDRHHVHMNSTEWATLTEFIKYLGKTGKKERMNRKPYWLFQGIVVKVMSKALADKGYYKQKGVVRKVIDDYVGEIEMIDSKHVLRVDQEELETVIPQIGGLVKIVNGAYRGSVAKLLGVDTEKFCAKVQIEKGVYEGRVIKSIEYEDICKLA